MTSAPTTTSPSPSSPSSSPSNQPTLHLHTYFRSSCSGRLRIALHLKHLPFTTTAIHLLRGEQTSPSYTSLNPSGTVPTLTHNNNTSSSSSSPPVVITQSVAALEYLDEAFPATRPLYPPASDPRARAAVRTLVGMVACDVQPVTNAKTIRAAKELGGDGAAGWAREWTTRGLDAVEAMLRRTQEGVAEGEARVCVPRAGVSAADVCLVPAVWAAQRWGCDLERWPRIMGVQRYMEGLEEVRKAHWRRQDDTPEEFRED